MSPILLELAVMCWRVRQRPGEQAASAYSTSQAAVIKLGENLAEVRRHNITVLSYHPGLCDIGMTHDHLARGITGDPWTDRIGEWLRAERAAGRFTPRR